MKMLETMLSAEGNAVVKQLAGQFGLDADQAPSSVSALLPALAGDLPRKTGGDGSGISNLMTSGKFSRFVENPSRLAGLAALDQGTSQVSKSFGSGDLTKVASTVAEKTGVSGTIISSMLPIRAALLGGVWAKSTAAGDNLTDVASQIANEGPGGLLDTLKNATQKMTGSERRGRPIMRGL
jgi:hypothetical protein